MNLAVEDTNEIEPLCCCEYIDLKNERNHILACCCNCEVFDEFVTRVICCRAVDKKLKKEMVLTVKDRIRCPFPGGAKQFVFVETLIPLIMIVICQLIAAVNLYFTVVIFVGTFIGLIYYRRRQYDAGKRTNFYSLLSFWSAFYLLALFQLNVPMLEILPEENLAYVILLTLTCGFYYKTRSRSTARHHHQDNESMAQLLVEEGEYLAESDVSDGTYHVWINTVIGRSNQRFYIIGCSLGILTFLIYADLVLTAVCHPVIVMKIFNYDFMVPDHCNGVYEQQDLALGFTGGLHSLLLALFILWKLIQEIFFKTNGAPTATKRGGERMSSRKSCLSNWKSFLCN